MTRRLALVAPLLILAGCHMRSAEPKVTDAWVRLPAVPGQPAAAYFTIQGGRSAKTLVRLESALANRIEMHQNMRGMFGLDPQVKPGTAVPIRFGFSDGTTTEAEAKTVPAGGDAPY
ncbi:MAG: copper chaperone PCu(A)C [Sphingomonas sp.]|nr:copper chaperone PCu(A)C [Sphingomonas sp.]